MKPFVPLLGMESAVSCSKALRSSFPGICVTIVFGINVVKDKLAGQGDKN